MTGEIHTTFGASIHRVTPVTLDDALGSYLKSMAHTQLLWENDRIFKDLTNKVINALKGMLSGEYIKKPQNSASENTSSEATPNTDNSLLQSLAKVCLKLDASFGAHVLSRLFGECRSYNAAKNIIETLARATVTGLNKERLSREQAIERKGLQIITKKQLQSLELDKDVIDRILKLKKTKTNTKPSQEVVSLKTLKQELQRLAKTPGLDKKQKTALTRIKKDINKAERREKAGGNPGYIQATNDLTFKLLEHISAYENSSQADCNTEHNVKLVIQALYEQSDEGRAYLEVRATIEGFLKGRDLRQIPWEETNIWLIQNPGVPAWRYSDVTYVSPKMPKMDKEGKIEEKELGLWYKRLHKLNPELRELFSVSEKYNLEFGEEPGRSEFNSNQHKRHIIWSRQQFQNLVIEPTKGGKVRYSVDVPILMPSLDGAQVLMHTISGFIDRRLSNLTEIPGSKFDYMMKDAITGESYRVSVGGLRMVIKNVRIANDGSLESATFSPRLTFKFPKPNTPSWVKDYYKTKDSGTIDIPDKLITYAYADEPNGLGYLSVVKLDSGKPTTILEGQFLKGQAGDVANPLTVEAVSLPNQVSGTRHTAEALKARRRRLSVTLKKLAEEYKGLSKVPDHVKRPTSGKAVHMKYKQLRTEHNGQIPPEVLNRNLRLLALHNWLIAYYKGEENIPKGLTKETGIPNKVFAKFEKSGTSLGGESVDKGKLALQAEIERLGRVARRLWAHERNQTDSRANRISGKMIRLVEEYRKQYPGHKHVILVEYKADRKPRSKSKQANRESMTAALGKVHTKLEQTCGGRPNPIPIINISGKGLSVVDPVTGSADVLSFVASSKPNGGVKLSLRPYCEHPVAVHINGDGVVTLTRCSRAKLLARNLTRKFLDPSTYEDLDMKEVTEMHEEQLKDAVVVRALMGQPGKNQKRVGVLG